MQLSIVIPVLNESASIAARLQSLRNLLTPIGSPYDTHQDHIPQDHAQQDNTQPPFSYEIILVDGGSVDGTCELAQPYVDILVEASKGRANQMNAGAKQANGRYILFLHIDTQLPSLSLTNTLGMEDKSLINNTFPFLISSSKTPRWGFYSVRLSGGHRLFRLIEAMMNLRSRITHIATGDQCLFVQKALFDQLGGFAAIPLMEDVELSKRLRQQSPPYMVKSQVVTSSRRWEEKGIIKTVGLMWLLRGLYVLGVPPATLVKRYY